TLRSPCARGGSRAGRREGPISAAATLSAPGDLADGDDGCRFEGLERGQTVFEIGLTSQDALLDERGRGRIRRRGGAQRAGQRLARGRVAHVSQDFDRPLICVELLLARVS